MISTYLKNKNQQQAILNLLIQLHMKWHIIGLVILLQWNGGMIYGWMKVMLISSHIFV